MCKRRVSQIYRRGILVKLPRQAVICPAVRLLSSHHLVLSKVASLITRKKTIVLTKSLAIIPCLA